MMSKCRQWTLGNSGTRPLLWQTWWQTWKARYPTRKATRAPVSTQREDPSSLHGHSRPATTTQHPALDPRPMIPCPTDFRPRAAERMGQLATTGRLKDMSQTTATRQDALTQSPHRRSLPHMCDDYVSSSMKRAIPRRRRRNGTAVFPPLPPLRPNSLRTTPPMALLTLTRLMALTL